MEMKLQQTQRLLKSLIHILLKVTLLKQAQDTGLGDEELAALHEETRTIESTMKLKGEERALLARKSQWLTDDTKLKEEKSAADSSSHYD